MHYIKSVTRTRVKKVIEKNKSGDFIYCELKEYNQAYMDKIQDAQSSEELVDLWQDIAENSHLKWYVNNKMPHDTINDFIAIDDLDKQKKLLAELLDKNQLYVHFTEIDDEKFDVSESDKMLNKDFYWGDSDA